MWTNQIRHRETGQSCRNGSSPQSTDKENMEAAFVLNNFEKNENVNCVSKWIGGSGDEDNVAPYVAPGLSMQTSGLPTFESE